MDDCEQILLDFNLNFSIESIQMLRFIQTYGIKKATRSQWSSCLFYLMNIPFREDYVSQSRLFIFKFGGVSENCFIYTYLDKSTYSTFLP